MCKKYGRYSYFIWKAYRKNRGEFEINSESQNLKMKTLKSRIELWTDDNGGVIGSPYVSMIDAFNRGLGDRMLIVPYEGITYHLKLDETNIPIHWRRILSTRF